MTQPNYITRELSKKLNPDNVSQRQQNGMRLDYIEAHYAIRRANEIFDFGGWTRETIENRCVSEREAKIGRQQKDGWRVTYVAKVRIHALGVIREGTGAGHGIDVDLGQAHESAIKEAESDAMKRALMTFGDQFGLALYDKTRANVGVEPEAPQTITEAQYLELTAMLDQLGEGAASVEKRILNRYKIIGLPKLPADKFELVKKGVAKEVQGQQKAQDEYSGLMNAAADAADRAETRIMNGEHFSDDNGVVGNGP